MTFFVIPVIGTGARSDPRRPKYISDIPGIRWSGTDHGDTFILAADTTAADELAIGTNADAIVFPAQLDAAVSVAQIQGALEAQDIPAHWIRSGMTHRQVLRVIVGMAQTLQRCEGVGVKVRIRGNMDRTVGSLAAPIRRALSDAADSMGLDRRGVVAATTVRELMAELGQQFLEGKGVHLVDL